MKKQIVILTILILSVLSFDNGCQNVPEGVNLNSYQYNNNVGNFATYMEWYTFYLYDYTQGVYFFVNNIHVFIHKIKEPLILSWPAFLTPQGHTGMELTPHLPDTWKIDEQTGNNSITLKGYTSKMSYGDGVAFAEGNYKSKNFEWNLKYEKVKSIPQACNAYKARIDLLSPEFSWIPTSPLNNVTGIVKHNGVVYNINSNGQMEHVFGKIFEPTLSWWYSISGVSKDEVLLLIAKGLPNTAMSKAVGTVQLWIKGVHYLWKGSEFTVDMHTKNIYHTPTNYTVVGTNSNGDKINIEITLEGESFVSDGQISPEEKKAVYVFDVTPKSGSTQYFKQYGWNEYNHFALSVGIKRHIAIYGGNYGNLLQRAQTLENERTNKKDEL